MENQELNLCACCTNTYQSVDTFCMTCGYPLQGSEDAQRNHIANRTIKEVDLIELDKKVKQQVNLCIGLPELWDFLA